MESKSQNENTGKKEMRKELLRISIDMAETSQSNSFAQ